MPEPTGPPIPIRNARCGVSGDKETLPAVGVDGGGDLEPDGGGSGQLGERAVVASAAIAEAASAIHLAWPATHPLAAAGSSASSFSAADATVAASSYSAIAASSSSPTAQAAATTPSATVRGVVDEAAR